MMRRLVCASIAGLLGASGCGASSFESKFQKPVAPTEINVAKQITKASARRERPVAVGITTEPSRLCAWDLSAGMLWELPIEAVSNPLVVGDAVVLQERQGIVVRDLGTGEVRVVVDDEGHLIGADGIGSTLVIAISYDQGDPRSKIIRVDGDKIGWRQSLNQPAGTPALLGDRVVVPWATQRLSVLSATDGAELARWNFTNLVISHALVDRGRVFVGEHGLLRVDDDLPAHRDGPVSLYAPLKRVLPGQPPLLRDGSQPVPSPDSAGNRLRVDWRVGSNPSVPSVEHDLLIERFYRVAFGLAASADEVRWVRVFDHDLIGSSVEPGGIWLVDSEGELRVLDASGSTHFSRSLGRSLRSVAIRPSEWVPANMSSTPTESPLGSLHDQLLSAARVNDDRLSAARAYTIERLATLKDPRVTPELIALCADAASPEPVSLSACTQLAAHGEGSADVLAALRQRASFLDTTAAPPVGALAQAAARMNLKPAAPLLVSQAEDPHTTSADLVALFQALAALDHRPAASTLERFVRLHHAEPQGSELGPALYAALDALGGLRAQTARATLTDIAADGLTSQGVRDKAREIIGVVDSPPVVAKPPVSAPPKPVEEPEVVEVETDPRPYSLSQGDVQLTLSPLHKSLLRCVQTDPSLPKSARVSIVISGDGSVEGIFVTPTSVQPCMDPILRAAKFPSTRLGRQHVTHTVQAANVPATSAPVAHVPVAKAPAAKASATKAPLPNASVTKAPATKAPAATKPASAPTQR